MKHLGGTDNNNNLVGIVTVWQANVHSAKHESATRAHPGNWKMNVKIFFCIMHLYALPSASYDPCEFQETATNGNKVHTLLASMSACLSLLSPLHHPLHHVYVYKRMWLPELGKCSPLPWRFQPRRQTFSCCTSAWTDCRSYNKRTIQSVMVLLKTWRPGCLWDNRKVLLVKAWRFPANILSKAN